MIGQPGHALIPLRTIERHSLVVAADTPPGILMNAVYYLIVSFKGTGGGQVIKDHLAFKIIYSRCTGIASDLYIPETMVYKIRHPGFDAYAFGGIDVCYFCIAQVAYIQF